MPVTQNFTARRNATWAPQLVYDYRGGPLPLAGGHIAMQLRLYPGQPYDAVLTLNPIPFTDEHVSGAGADEVRRLTLSPSISADQLLNLPGLHTPEIGDSQIFADDIRITYADGVSEVLSAGLFTLKPGVTTV